MELLYSVQHMIPQQLSGLNIIGQKVGETVDISYMLQVSALWVIGRGPVAPLT